MPAKPAPTMRTSCWASTRLRRYPMPGPAALDARAGLGDLAVRVAELGEVLQELRRELVGLGVVRLLIPPGGAGVEEARVDARHLAGDLEAEDRILAISDVVELAGDGGVEKRSRRGDRHPVALAERTARPAGVHEPDRRVVVFEL